jgi:thiol-disulfide isomerase/thioredoxin
MDGLKVVAASVVIGLVLTAVPAADTLPAPDDFRSTLPKLWQKQRDLMTAGRFTVRVARLQPSLTREELDKLLATIDLKDVPGFMEKLYGQFPAKGGAHHLPLSPVEVRADRGRCMEIWHKDPPAEKVLDRVSCNVAGVHVSYHPGNRQATVSPRGVSVLHVDRLRYLPRAAGDLPATWQMVKWNDGRLTLKHGTGATASEMVVDGRNGFVYLERHPDDRDGTRTREVRQLGPVTDPKGRILPTVHAEVSFDGNQVEYLAVTHIAKADLDVTFTDADFVVSAPARTNVVDTRGATGTNAKTKVAREAVPDVLAFANAIPDEARSVWPVLKPGTPAPALDGVTWLTGDAPALKGKVLLVDFWGLGCGPCLAELPAVQVAAQKHAAAGLVVVGLHDAHGKTDKVAAYGHEHGLTFPLAIDKAADKSFGATFQAYGVRAVPNAAVVDREGNVVFVGRFPEALAKAEKLLGQAKRP